MLPRTRLTESMRWHRRHEKATLYSVLNASRAWRFAAEGALGSKLEGAAWARDRPAFPNYAAGTWGPPMRVATRSVATVARTERAGESCSMAVLDDAAFGGAELDRLHWVLAPARHERAIRARGHRHR